MNKDYLEYSQIFHFSNFPLYYKLRFISNIGPTFKHIELAVLYMSRLYKAKRDSTQIYPRKYKIHQI